MMYVIQFWIDFAFDIYTLAWPIVAPYIKPTSAMLGDPSNTRMKFVETFFILVKNQYFLITFGPDQRLQARARLELKCPEGKRATIFNQWQE